MGLLEGDGAGGECGLGMSGDQALLVSQACAERRIDNDDDDDEIVARRTPNAERLTSSG
jgi:hypothetical protein